MNEHHLLRNNDLILWSVQRHASHLEYKILKSIFCGIGLGATETDNWAAPLSSLRRLWTGKIQQTVLSFH